jgi:hypothetical protein
MFDRLRGVIAESASSAKLRAEVFDAMIDDATKKLDEANAAKRRPGIAQLEALRSAVVPGLAKAQASVSKRRERIAALESELKAERLGLADDECALMSVRWSRDGAIERVERELKDSSPPAITEFQTQCRMRQAELLATSVAIQPEFHRNGKKWFGTLDLGKWHALTSHESHVEALTETAELLRQAELLKLSAASAADAEAALEPLRERLRAQTLELRDKGEVPNESGQTGRTIVRSPLHVARPEPPPLPPTHLRSA